MCVQKKEQTNTEGCQERQFFSSSGKTPGDTHFCHHWRVFEGLQKNDAYFLLAYNMADHKVANIFHPKPAIHSLLDKKLLPGHIFYTRLVPQTA